MRDAGPLGPILGTTARLSLPQKSDMDTHTHSHPHRDTHADRPVHAHAQSHATPPPLLGSS